jgi:hypothetical protein
MARNGMFVAKGTINTVLESVFFLVAPACAFPL